MSNMLVVRPYELQLYDLLDSYVTTIRPYGQSSIIGAKDSSMIIKNDGTEELSFSLPMYYREHGEIKLSPYAKKINRESLLNGLYKVKVFFEKGDPKNQKIFEFIISKVKVYHKEGILGYEISCEGLAFNELGKTGYKLVFNEETFQIDYEKAIEEDPSVPLKANLKYWMNQVIEGTKWDWSSPRNLNSSGQAIHSDFWPLEEPHATDWEVNSGKLVPKEWTDSTVKERIIKIQESNRYNIIQTIAEVFGVKCQFIYEHDFYGHIIGRVVQLFDAELKEDEGKIDINYKYNTSSIQRTIDSQDVVTKMYVAPVDDISITSVGSNKTMEDYIYNFDYLRQVGAVDLSVLRDLPAHEQELREYNLKITGLQDSLNQDQESLVEQEVAYTIADNGYKEAGEQIDLLEKQINSLVGTSGVVSFYKPASGGEGNPYVASLIVGTDGRKYVKAPYENIYNATAYYKRSSDQSFVKLTIVNIESTDTETRFYFSLGDSIKSLVVYLYFDYIPTEIANKKELINQYRILQAKHLQDKEKADNARTLLTEKIENGTIELQASIEEKNKKIEFFEKRLGAAIREGSWLPDEYKDFGARHTINNVNFTLEGEDEEKLLTTEYKPYYLSGILSDKVYYPRIDLYGVTFTGAQLNAIKEHYTDLCIMKKPLWVEVYRGVWNSETRYAAGEYVWFENSYYVSNDSNKKASPKYGSTTGHWQKITTLPANWDSLNSYSANDIVVTSPFSVYKCLENNVNKNPLENSEEKKYYLNSSVFAALTKKDNDIFYSLFIPEKIIINDSFSFGYMSSTGNFVEIKSGLECKTDTTPVVFVYPRILIDDESLKQENDVTFQIFSGASLERYKDFTLIFRYLNNKSQYLFTPNDVFLYAQLSNTNHLSFPEKAAFVSYTSSNAAESIYLDALSVSKENAFPKVSYDVEVAAVNEKVVRYLYNMIDKICSINDEALFFHDVRGYISEMTLDLEDCTNDKITITNYKNKFEDIFSTIVAQTQDMKKNNVALTRAGASFSSTGLINKDVIQDTLNSEDLSIDLEGANVKITKKDGIVLHDGNGGAVSIRGDGIFVAENNVSRSVDANYNWKKVITSEGMNAEMLKYGTLNTSMVRIFADDDVAFQLNKDGLFAYKKEYSEDNTYIGVNPNIYVVHDDNGLFLKSYSSEKATMVSRVEVSWDGFIIRDEKDNKVFYADDEGNLTLAGIIEAAQGHIGPWSIAEDSIYKLSSEIEQDETATSFFNANTAYFGDKGLSFSDVFKVEIDRDTLKVKDFFIGKKTQDLNNSAVFRIYLDDTETDNDGGYRVVLNNVTFAGDFILPIENGGTGTNNSSMAIQKIPIGTSLPADPSPGDLVLLYDPGVQASLNTVLNVENYFSPHLALVDEDKTFFLKNNTSFYQVMPNIYANRWNTAGQAEEVAAAESGFKINNKIVWSRAGVATNANNSCATVAKLEMNFGESEIDEVKVSNFKVHFKYSNRRYESGTIGAAEWDQLNETDRSSSRIQVAIIEGYGNSRDVMRYTTLCSSSFLPSSLEGEKIANLPITLSNPITFHKTDPATQENPYLMTYHYYVVFYSRVEGTLIYIKVDDSLSLIANEVQSEEQLPELQVYSGSGWKRLAVGTSLESI